MRDTFLGWITVLVMGCIVLGAAVERATTGNTDALDIIGATMLATYAGGRLYSKYKDGGK